MYRATVFASHPASCAADQAVPVRSNASKISMISLPDLVTGPSGHRWVRRITQTHPHRRDHQHHDTPDASREPATRPDRKWPQGWRNNDREPGANWPHTRVFVAASRLCTRLVDELCKYAGWRCGARGRARRLWRRHPRLPGQMPVVVEYSAVRLDLGFWRRHDRHPCLSRWLTGCW